MEGGVHLKRCSLTPRNITPKKKSKIIQVAVQHQSISAKVTHKLLASLDDQLKEKEYADLAKEILQESIDNFNHLIDINNLRK